MPELIFEKTEMLDKIWDVYHEVMFEELFSVSGLYGDSAIQEVNPMVFVKEVDLQPDKIKVNITVRYRFLYWNHEEHVRSFTTDRDYDIEKEVNQNASSCIPNITVESMEIDNSIGGKIHSRLRLNVKLICKSIKEFDYVNEINDDETVDIRKNSVTISKLVGIEKKDISIDETINVPNDISRIGEILTSNIFLRGNEIQVHDDNMMTKGTAVIQICYTDSDENEIHYIEDEFVFSRQIEATYYYEGLNVFTNCYLQDVEIMPNEDDDGELRQFRLNANIMTETEIFENAELSYVEDMYDATNDLEAVVDRQNTVFISLGNGESWPIRESISLYDTSKIDIFGISCQTNDLKMVTENDELWIEGSINVNVIYKKPDDEGSIGYHKTWLPLRKKANFKDDVDGKISLEIYLDNWGWNNRDMGIIDVWCELREEIKFLSDREILIPKELKKPESTNAYKGHSGVKVYFTQNGEQLWDVGKKFKISQEQLAKCNPHLGDEGIENGTQVVVL